MIKSKIRIEAYCEKNNKQVFDKDAIEVRNYCIHRVFRWSAVPILKSEALAAFFQEISKPGKIAFRSRALDAQKAFAT